MVYLRRFKKADGKYSDGANVHKIEVPRFKFWKILRCSQNAGDSATRAIKILDVDGDEIGSIVYGSAGTGLICGPQAPTSNAYFDSNACIAYEGETVKFQFGANQTTGGDYIELIVLEYDMREEMHLI